MVRSACLVQERSDFARVNDEWGTIDLTQLASMQFGGVVERGPRLRKPVRGVRNARRHPHALTVLQLRDAKKRSSATRKCLRNQQLIWRSVSGGFNSPEIETSRKRRPLEA